MLKLYRRKGSQNLYIRGAFAGQDIHESTGTSSKVEANQILKGRKREILERCELGERATITFETAALSYMDFTGQERFIDPLLEHFGQGTVLAKIKQKDADTAARKLHPKGANATLVRQVYTPLIAILRHAAHMDWCELPAIKKPKIEHVLVEPATEEWFDKVLPHCSPKLGGLLTFLSFTAARISEALRLQWENIEYIWEGDELVEVWANIGRDKRGRPYRVALHQAVVVALANLPGEHKTGQVFEYANRSCVYGPTKTACTRAGVEYKATHASGRHVFAARWLANGGTLVGLKDAARYSNISTPDKYYGHLEKSPTDDAVRALPRRKSGANER